MSNTACKCGVLAAVRTSNTAGNPNRAFFTCSSKKCNYFAWCDTHGLRADKSGEAFHVQIKLGHNT